MKRPLEVSVEICDEASSFVSMIIIVTIKMLTTITDLVFCTDEKCLRSNISYTYKTSAKLIVYRCAKMPMQYR
jgi:hypothetical protein